MKDPIKITIPVTERTADHIHEAIMTGAVVLLIGIMVIACGAMLGFMVGLLIEMCAGVFTGTAPNISDPIMNHTTIVVCTIGGVIVSLLYSLVVIGVVEIGFKKEKFGSTK